LINIEYILRSLTNNIKKLYNNYFSLRMIISKFVPKNRTDFIFKLLMLSSSHHGASIPKSLPKVSQNMYKY
jgi:hypothetical protein